MATSTLQAPSNAPSGPNGGTLPSGPQKMITANSVTDGRVVYLASGGVWTRHIGEGELLTEDPRVESSLSGAVADQISVCSPYAIEVELTERGPTPVKLRERIRSRGPTTGLTSSAPPRG